MKTVPAILLVLVGCIAIAVAVSFIPISANAQSSLSFLLSMPLGAFVMLKWLDSR